MATVQDVAPTLLMIAGANPPADDFDGRNLWSALKTNTSAPVMEYIIQTRQFSEIEAVYRYPFKLIEEGSSRTLYNVEVDPLETTDIASEESAIVTELSRYLAAFPRGKNVALPLQSIVDDTDYFGGEEDRAPWADQPFQPDGE